MNAGAASNESAASAEAFCANLVRSRDFPSYAASLFVSSEPRRAWLALAAFNAEVAHVRDAISQPMPGEIRLQWWRDVLTGAGSTEGIDGNPVASELQRAITHYDLPKDMLVRLVDAHVFDVYDDPMPDMAALEAHCRDTSAALFKLRAIVLGASGSDVQRAADHAGIAEGLVDVMLALPKHASRRQLYLPAELMNLHGAITEEIFLRHPTAQLRKVLAHLRDEANAQLDKTMALLDEMPPQFRVVFLPVVRVGDMLERLDSSKVFEPPVLSRLRVLWDTWSAARSNPFRA